MRDVLPSVGRESRAAAPRRGRLENRLPPVEPPVEAIGAPPVTLSVVAPVFDERENLRRLHAEIAAALGEGDEWELVLVDDGSRDGSDQVIRDLAHEDRRVVGVLFGANRGQSAATAAGVQAARGEIVATLDADLQNDPKDLVSLVDALGEHDAVVGYRMRRHDSLVRRLSSRIGNGVRNALTRDSIRDTGCSLKLFRARAIQNLPLFEGMHRFLPTLLRYHGFVVVEHPVSHHPRTAGVSKYGVGNRAWRAFKDLLAVRWMRTRMIRPATREVLRGG